MDQPWEKHIFVCCQQKCEYTTFALLLILTDICKPCRRHALCCECHSSFAN